MSNVQVVFHIQDEHGIPLVNVLLTATSSNGNWQGLTDVAGNFDSGSPQDGMGLAPGSYHLKLTKPGYQDTWIESKDKPTVIGGPGTITWAMPLVHGKGISVSGKEFLLSGHRWKPIGCTDFLLVQRKSQGQDIQPILEQRKKVGFDTVRIFTMCHNIVHFDPRSYDVQGVLSDTLDVIGSFDMNAEVVGICDAVELGLNKEEQQKHHQLVTDVLRTKHNVIYELANEFEKNLNNIEPGEFPKPTGVISCSGSRVNNDPPKQPYWDYCTFHPRRDGEDPYFSKWRADIGPQSEVYNGVMGNPPVNHPIFVNEPRGFASENIPGKRSNEPRYAYQIGWLYHIFLNGSVFHSTNGITSDLFDEITERCAYSFVIGCIDAVQGW